MQNSRPILETETLSNSLAPMNENWESLQSLHSGTVFPIRNVKKGQLCFREDELAIYSCIDVDRAVWIKIADLKLTYTNKEYVDGMKIDLARITNLIDNVTNKIKMSLLNTGTNRGQLVVVGNNNKIDSSLIDAGVNAGQIVKVPANGKLPNSLLNVGVQVGQIPVLDSNGLLTDSIIGRNIPRLDASGKLQFPNGAKIWVA